MDLRRLLHQSHQRLLGSGLLMWGIIWSLSNLLLFYWPSQLLLAPWLSRLSAVSSLDLSLLGLPWAWARETGVLGLLLLLYVLHLAITPAIDAFVYGRLLRLGERGYSYAGFYRLFVLQLLAVSLVLWLLYLGQRFCWQILNQPALLLLIVIIMAALLWAIGLGLSWERTRIASRRRRSAWPPFRLWMLTAVAQGCLTLVFSLLLSVLYYGIGRLQGFGLMLILLLASSVRVYGRLWKLACAVQVWQEQ